MSNFLNLDSINAAMKAHDFPLDYGYTRLGWYIGQRVLPDYPLAEESDEEIRCEFRLRDVCSVSDVPIHIQGTLYRMTRVRTYGGEEFILREDSSAFGDVVRATVDIAAKAR